MPIDYNETHRTSFKCPEPIRDALDDEADRRDTSRSDLLREAAIEYAETHGLLDDETDEGDDLPEDDQLREAYLQLWAVARNDPYHRVSVEQAKAKLWSQRVPKDTVRRELLTPLSRAGYVNIRPTLDDVQVYVRPRPEAEA